MSLNKTVDSDISRQDDSAHTDHVVKRKRIKKAREQARAFLGTHGCRTRRIRGDRELNYFLSLCFGVFIDCNAKPKHELIQATRIIDDMGREARKRKIRAALKGGHPAIRLYWDPNRIPR
jgi:hypothetical protein